MLSFAVWIKITVILSSNLLYTLGWANITNLEQPTCSSLFKHGYISNETLTVVVGLPVSFYESLLQNL